MEKNNFKKKAQGLPLNTIVIAILVIIVLLVIVVFFTTNIGKQGETLGETTKGITDTCDSSNPILSNYENVNIGSIPLEKGETCQTEYGNTYSKIIGTNCCVIK